MRFETPLAEGRFLRRYKRFFADIALPDGREIVAHCPNPGRMTGIDTPGARAFVSPSTNPKRRLQWTLEILEADNGGGPVLVGANTNRANGLAAEAIAAGGVPALAGYSSLRREVAYGRASRIDFLLENAGRPPCYVEVKNVHLARRSPLAEFPDCPTARGAKHLDELAEMARAGARAVVLFVVQRADIDRFALARDIDPALAAGFDRALDAGVEAHALRAVVTPREIVPDAMVPVLDATGEPILSHRRGHVKTSGNA